MREHEVPTHVQAEDRVLLWLTFPQIVAVTAVCALSYGAYRFAPIGPSEVRIALSAVLGLLGVAIVVGRIGGRRLPLVAADLLRFWLGPRLYEGAVGELVRTEAPPPPPSSPNAIELAVRRTRRKIRKIRKKGRSERMPFRAHRWFGKRRKQNGERSAGKVSKGWLARCRKVLMVIVFVGLSLSMPGKASADGHTLDEVEFRPPEPVPGRRLYVEGLSIAEGWADVDVRAATQIDSWARAYGGPDSRSMLYWGRASLEQGDSHTFRFPLRGPAPYVTLSWRDSIGEAGAISLQGERLPFPLPHAEGELCDLEFKSLGWTEGVVEGSLSARCMPELEERVDLSVLAGHQPMAIPAILMGSVTAIDGQVLVRSHSARSAVPFISGGETEFSLAVPGGEFAHEIDIEAGLVGTLEIPLPAQARLTLHKKSTELRTQTVSVFRPGTSRRVTRTVSVDHDDGTTTQHDISAVLSIPDAEVSTDVTVSMEHPEHIRAEIVSRGSVTRERYETVTLSLDLGTDAPYEALTLPEPVEPSGLGEQTRLSDAQTTELFERIGWRWQR